ncbi:MAG: Ppx/GppA phosphatase family protein [Hyphomicrobiaceae bacterium]
MRARSRLDDRPPVAVIDIGSNSVRLVVYEGPTRSPTPLFNEKVLCGLGRAVAHAGRLDGESVEKTFEALRRFRLLTEELGAGKPWIIATAAVRDARNCDAFVAEVEAITGARVMLLSGEREAELAAAGIVAGFHQPDGIAGDLGGGSLELIDLSGETLRNATTLGLGGLNLIERAGGDLGRAAKIVDESLARTDWLKAGAGRLFYAVGGTWRNIAKLHIAETHYPLHVTHGYSVAPAEMQLFCERLAKSRKLQGVADLRAVSAARREVIPFGALVLSRLIAAIRPKAVVCSIFGIREGLIHQILPVEERRRDPLLAFCEEYALLRSRSPTHARELGTWTDALFQPPGPPESEDERRLRYAACTISDISWRAHQDYRGEQSLNVIAHASLTGIDHGGRIFLALAVYFRHTGGQKNAFSSRLMQLLPKGAVKRAKIIGAAVRTAHMISAGMHGVMDRTRLHYEKDRLVLELAPSIAALDGERLRKRLGVLAELLDRKPIVRIAGDLDRAERS